MRIACFLLMVVLILAGGVGYGQGTAPTFRYKTSQGTVTELPGRDPAQGGTTVIPTVLVPVRLQFDARQAAGNPMSLDAAEDIPQVLRSPVFSKAAFGAEAPTQYVDAMLRTTTGTAADWHTLLGQPQVRPVTVEIPVGYGYVLTSKHSGTLLAMVDAEYLQRAIFQQIPHEDGKLVIALTHQMLGQHTTRFADQTDGLSEIEFSTRYVDTELR
jgi:chitinase